MSNEKPILFKDEMIRAIMEGRKCQTRRIVKGAPTTEVGHRLICSDNGWNWQADQEGVYPSLHREIDDPMQCPYGKPGSRLWVKEVYGYKIRSVGGTPRYERVAYRATDPDAVSCYDCNGKEQPLLWQPAETMPREVSRITLEITDVRVERLCNITESDAEAEGVEEE